MPQWMHDRARHIQAKNPSMPESEAFAIATQQSHAVGKSPKGFGTTEGRQTAKKKYDTPGDDKKTADPGGIGKEAGLHILLPFIEGFTDELQKIAQAGLSDTPTPQIGTVKSTAPKDLAKPGNVPKYAPVNSGASTSPIAQHQPVLASPPVRT